MALCLCALVALLGAVSWMIWPPGIHRVQHQANPNSVYGLLSELPGETSSHATIILAPGIYRSPLRFASHHAGLVIRANGPGVILNSGDVPAIELQNDVSGIVLAGPMTVRTQARRPVILGADSELTLKGVRLENTGRILVNGAKLHFNEVQSAVSLEAIDAELSLKHSNFDKIESPWSIQSSVLIADKGLLRSQLSYEGALLQAEQSSFRLNGMVIEAPNAHTGLLTDGCSWLEMTDVDISSRYRAWHSIDTQAVSVQHVSLRADVVGMSWKGARQADWQWSEMKFSAAQPSNGVAVHGLAGIGAREQNLPARP
jgi:hypothetical protein